MVAGETKTDLDLLLAKSYESKLSRECWALKITDERLRAYLDALRRAYAEGKRPVWVRVAEVLEEDFGISMGYETIRRHVSGGCRCAM